jgi:hypothetical protein
MIGSLIMSSASSSLADTLYSTFVFLGTGVAVKSSTALG